MVRGSLTRAGIAGAVSFALAVGLAPLSAGSVRAAPVAGEVVVPATYVLDPQTQLLSAGPSGFLRHESTLGHLWTSYAGVDTKLDMSGTDAVMLPDFGAGSDIVASPDLAARTVTLRDMATGRTRTVEIPVGHTYVSTLGSTVVTRAQASSDGDHTWHLLDSHDDGSVTRRAVAGVPDGITGSSEVGAPLGDARGQVVQYRVGSTPRTGFLDVEQGRLVPLPYASHAGTGTVVLTATHLLWLHNGTVSVHSRGDLAATPRTVPLTGGSQVLGMVGETLVVGRHDPSLGPLNHLDPVWRVEAVALDGRPVKTLVARSEGIPMPTPDGRLLVQGGPDLDRWGISVVEPADGGDVTIRKIAEAYPRKLQAVSGLTFTQGRLTTLEHHSAWQERRHLHTREIGVTGSRTVGARTDRGPAPASCDTTACPDLHDTGDGRTVVSGLSYGRTDDDRQPRLLEPTGSMPGTRIDSTRTYQSVAAVGGRFAALTMPYAGTGVETRVLDLGTGGTVFTTTATVEALWGTTLWVRDGNDAVAPVDVLTRQRGARVWFGSGCLLEDLQAVGRWLLWTCVGSAAGQGVYDTVRKTNLRLVAGDDWSSAKLGDGFVASEVNGQLKVTDVRGGTPVSHTAGAFASWRPWDVDPYTGVIAHLGPDDGIHLVPSGIPVSPLVQVDAAVATSAHVKGATGHWSPKWWLSKPAASWTLVIRSQSGAVVRTLTGGLTRGLVAPTWNGRDDRRRLMPNGAYTWTLTATPADGHGAVLTRSGSVRITHQCHTGNRPQLVMIRCA
ncbi:FlgD immunoglobulin-like domain containing protein [Micromonospora sp. NPDC047670]|uniref:FlgD immunoglobulin-like domain containing protein n=1 Tax=Micromonospora sp. NPDC047670 TaxID=3364252 RepID=UPI0037248D75